MPPKYPRLIRPATIVLLALACASCAYYRVTDLESGKVFYTHGCLPFMVGRYGSMKFHELAGGDLIILQNARTTKITRDEAEPARAR